MPDTTARIPRKRRKPGDPELHMAGRPDIKMAGENKHAVQANALDQFVRDATPLRIRMKSGHVYEDAALCAYDQFAITAVCQSGSLFLWKHGIEAIEVI